MACSGIKGTGQFYHLFFKLEALEAGGRSGHELKLFKKRFRPDIKKFVSVIELWINGTFCLYDVLIAAI